jgi:succinate dehydrogenase / fumarate reductase, cytochrome b subunit
MGTASPRGKGILKEEKIKIPRAFILRRVHSLLGLWLVVYLFEHLLVNSQVALFSDDQGSGFVAMVNRIHALPYLHVIEILFLGVPFFMHGVWGIIYLFTSKHNSLPTDGTAPQLTQYPRNHAYSWQRYTSWILLVGIFVHVVHMRFQEYPTLIFQWGEKEYMMPLKMDRGLYAVANILGVVIYDPAEIANRESALQKVEEQLKRHSSNRNDDEIY